MIAGLALLMVLATGCNSWHGEAAVTLNDGTVIHCPRGLRFSTTDVICVHREGERSSIDWKVVAGFRAGAAR